MGGMCSMHGICENCITKFWLDNLKGRDYLEDWMIILKRILNKWDDNVWIRLV
jgi:hypothetical protein